MCLRNLKRKKSCLKKYKQYWAATGAVWNNRIDLSSDDLKTQTVIIAVGWW